jgi:hypothetical protein
MSNNRSGHYFADLDSMLADSTMVTSMKSKKGCGWNCKVCHPEIKLKKFKKKKEKLLDDEINYRGE